MRADVRFLSSDLLEGRGPATRGDRLARGVPRVALRGDRARARRPGGAWEQRVRPRRRDRRLPRGAARLERRGRHGPAIPRGLRRLLGDRRPRRRAWTTPRSCSSATASWRPEHGWDDYKGADLRGKRPPRDEQRPRGRSAGCSPASAGSTTAAGTTSTRWRPGSAPRARSSSTPTPRPATAGRWSSPRGPASSSSLPAVPGEPTLPVKAWATEEACRRIARLGGHDLDALRAAAERRDFRPVPLGVRLSLALRNEVSRRPSANVIGRLPGRDPVLSGEAVVYTAHHDHLGAKPGPTGRARRLQRRPRQRLRARHDAGDRRGVRRAARAAAPLDPLRGRGGRGAGAARLGAPRAPPAGAAGAPRGERQHRRHEHLGPHARRPGHRPRQVLARRLGPRHRGGPGPDRGPGGLSGQGRLLPLRPPELRPRRRAGGHLDAGTEVLGKPPGWGRDRQREWEAAHYHQPTDDLTADWDFSGAIEDAQLLFLLGAKVADAPLAPSWRPGDEFEAARKKALAELGR